MGFSFAEKAFFLLNETAKPEHFFTKTDNVVFQFATSNSKPPVVRISVSCSSSVCLSRLSGDI